MMNSRYYEVNYAQYAMQLLTNNYRIDMVIAIICFPYMNSLKSKILTSILILRCAICRDC